MDVVALASEKRMRRDMHLDQRIAGRPAAKTEAAFALQAQDLTLLDPRRDRHVEPFLGRQGEPLFAAGRRLDEIDRQRIVAVGAGHRKAFAATPAPRTTTGARTTATAPER